MIYPKVIALVTAYNAEKFIIETLESIAAQTYANFEVILCDDCSKDNTFKVCQDFAKDHPNFTILRNEVNLGWFSNSENLWRKGVELGEYCFLHPHDDILFDGFIAEQIKVLEENPQAALAIPGMKNIGLPFIQGNSFCVELSNSITTSDLVTTLIKKQVHGWWAAYHGIHRSSVVKKILPVAKLRIGNPEHMADLLWMIKLSFHGQFISTNKVLFQKNYNSKTLSASWDFMSKKNKVGIYLAIAEEIVKSPLSLKEKLKIGKKILPGLLVKVKNQL
ncbi:glycosyltransferase family 2 protein [Algoriphagus yeomjeoni]|uniref:glycosyltransferase family 2 protein n=1 Tax=Algoriphagus yeomjeoni TaxID=291403 RepID=UPI003CE4D86C